MQLRALEEWRILDPTWKNSPRLSPADPISFFFLVFFIVIWDESVQSLHPRLRTARGSLATPPSRPRTVGGQDHHSVLSLFSRWILVCASANIRVVIWLPWGDSKQIQCNTINTKEPAGLSNKRHRKLSHVSHISFGLPFMLNRQ